MNNNKTTEINNSNEAEHISKLTGRTYQIGSLVCPNTGKAFDITVITDYHNDVEDSEFEIVNFYFGDYDYDTTEQYIALTLKEATVEGNVFAVYCQDTLNVLNARQVLEGPMPADWNKYCEAAQHVDPNGDWTNVEYTPDNLQALIYFYTEQVDELSSIETTETEMVALTEDMPTFITLSIEDVVAMSTTDDDIFDDELVELRVLRDTSNTTGGYDILSLNVLAQNVAGCIDETATTHIPVVEISNAQLTLIQIAMEFSMAHMKQMYTELCDGDMTIDNVTGYYEELDKMYKLIDKATFSDDFDIQIRN